MSCTAFYKWKIKELENVIRKVSRIARKLQLVSAHFASSVFLTQFKFFLGSLE